MVGRKHQYQRTTVKFPIHSVMMFIHHLPPSQYSQHLHDRNKQGKVAELKIELNNSGGKKDKNFLGKKVALKKIVANMTMSNNDMVALFADIIQCMSIPNLEIKKMYVVLQWEEKTHG